MPAAPAPGNCSFLLCGDHNGPSGTGCSLRSSWDPLPSPPPHGRCLLGPQWGAPPSGEVCAVRCNRTPEASPPLTHCVPRGQTISSLVPSSFRIGAASLSSEFVRVIITELHRVHTCVCVCVCDWLFNRVLRQQGAVLPAPQPHTCGSHYCQEALSRAHGDENRPLN